MKGNIFILLEDFLIEKSGMDLYTEILSECSFPTQEGFISTAKYPDAYFEELIQCAVKIHNVSAEQMHCQFGRWLLPHLTRLVPDYMFDHSHPATFLKTVDYLHRVELKKLYPDANPPQFSYHEISSDSGILIYRSGRALFSLVEGVLMGVADYFDVGMSIELKASDKESGVCEFLIHYHE